MTTILIRGGRVLDGSGAAALEADVLIEQDRSAGQTLMLFHKYSGAPGREEILDAVLSNPLCLFETDALVTSKGYPNPAAIGTFPRILGEFVRKRKLFGIEDGIRRMT